MSRECYWCGRHPMRGHEPACPAERGVPASHRPEQSTQPIALPPLDPDTTADDEATAERLASTSTASRLPPHRVDRPYVPAWIRRQMGLP